MCVCVCFPAIFGQELLARNYGKYIKFLAKEIAAGWGKLLGMLSKQNGKS